MQKLISIDGALETLLPRISALDGESLPLFEAAGRVAFEEVRAGMSIPPFARSPYDGYAFRACDVKSASKEKPAVLRVVREMAAGSPAGSAIGPGEAVRLMTGAPVPPGADAVVKYEMTEFTKTSVSIFEPARPGQDVIPEGEDIEKGGLIAKKGERLDTAALGMLAAQGLDSVLVYRRPVVGILSTGSELAVQQEAIGDGKIYDSNRYSLGGACAALGLSVRFIGARVDTREGIAAGIREGLESCDALITTGGVSVGDYDFTAQAAQDAGVCLAVRNVNMKPGGTCAIGLRGEKPVFCLSGNPASSLIAFYVLAQPCLRKLCGLQKTANPMVSVRLAKAIKKPSPKPRLIRGELDLSGGAARLLPHEGQGNGVLRSMRGCDLIGLIPEGSPPLPEGESIMALLVNAYEG